MFTSVYEFIIWYRLHNCVGKKEIRVPKVLNSLLKNIVFTPLSTWSQFLFTQYSPKTLRFPEDLQKWLIIFEVYDIPLDTFEHIFILFSCYHILSEVKLKCLIGKVYAELFKAISMNLSDLINKNFESKNIQDSNHMIRFSKLLTNSEFDVDFIYYPIKHSRIYKLSQSIPQLLCKS